MGDKASIRVGQDRVRHRHLLASGVGRAIAPPVDGNSSHDSGLPGEVGGASMNRLRNLDVGAVIFGLLLLGVGVYYLLVNTFGISLPELNWDQIWPIAVIAIGLGILGETWNRMSRGGGVPRT
jgi:hypothetical protein